MIIDSSAIVAVLLAEVDAERIGRLIGAARRCRVGAPTLVETMMVLTGRRGAQGKALLGSFLYEKSVEVIPFTDEHARVAQDAFVRFGKGRHPAGLNFGDCLTYAVAAVADEPLLCVGDDFPRTDLVLAS